MAEATEAWNWYSCGPERRLDMVDDMIAAANIPEGPPVGTIARRPDGFWIAHMTESGWEYTELVTGTWRGPSADSWPHIRPDEWPDQAGLDWFPPGEEPIVPRPDPGSKDAGDWIKAQVVHSGGSLWRRDGYMWRGVGHTGGRSPLPSLARPGVAVTVVIDDDGELVSDLSKLACIDGDVEELLAEHGLLPDPTAQQEPGESLARGLDDLAAGRVSRRDDYLEPQQEPEDPREGPSCGHPDHGNTGHFCQPFTRGQLKPPRTPRVVDRLGVDEQGSRWLDVFGWVWSFENGWWKTKNGSLDYGCVDPSIRGPFKEILEPRVLPSLDCKEARDGTVWEARYVLLAGREQTPGWKFQHTQDGWVYEDGSRVLSPEFLTGRGPYTEVLGDPS